MPTEPAQVTIWPPPALAEGIAAMQIERMDLDDLANVVARGEPVTAAHLSRAIHLASEYEMRDAYERRIEAMKDTIRNATDALNPKRGVGTNRTSGPVHEPGSPAARALAVLLS